jgi:hypothetical protein
MSKIKYVITIVVLFASILSCNDDLTSEKNIVSEDKDIRIENGTLVFRNEVVYNDVKSRLNSMSITEQIAFFDSIGFKSQYYIMHEADKELEQLCNTSETIEEFKPKYGSYKQKYDGLFMFNDGDVEDLSPYYKLSQPRQELFANAAGLFVIGDSVVEGTKFASFYEYYLKVTPVTLRSEVSTEATWTNHAWSHQSKRKVGFYVSINNVNVIHGQFTAQIKNIFGWVRYSPVYSFKIYVYEGSMDFFREYSDRVVYWGRIMPGGFAEHEIALSGNDTREIGIKQSPTKLKGRIEIWSSGVNFTDRGISYMYL